MTVSIGISIHTTIATLLLCFIQNGKTPLMTASFYGHVDIVRIVIDAQAQVNIQSKVCTQLSTEVY